MKNIEIELSNRHTKTALSSVPFTWLKKSLINRCNCDVFTTDLYKINPYAKI